MILCDKDIIDLCLLHAKPMIEPFVGYGQCPESGVISYGISSAGYDLRLAEEVLFFSGHSHDHFGKSCLVDPKAFGDAAYRETVLHSARYRPGEQVVIPPRSYILGRSHEYLRLPRVLKGRCVGKSTLARSGILINTTPLEPEWEGHLTIEIGNVTSMFAAVYCMEGIAQLEFELLTKEPQVTYAGKGGKYQAQTGVTPARVL